MRPTASATQTEAAPGRKPSVLTHQRQSRVSVAVARHLVLSAITSITQSRCWWNGFASLAITSPTVSAGKKKGRRKLRYLVLDLETLPIDSAADFVSVADIAAPSNYKDEEKIAAYCEAERVKRIAAAALDMDLARVCALGITSDGTVDTVMAKDEATERDLFLDLAASIARADREPVQIITFNGFKYDLPLLMRRARYLDVDFPRINLDRYRSPHTDLYEELTMRGAIKAHGLRWYMRRHGWTDLLDADPLKDGGADVSQAAAEGRWEDIAAHVRVDVMGTYRLAQWLGVIPKDEVAF